MIIVYLRGSLTKSSIALSGGVSMQTIHTVQKDANIHCMFLNDSSEDSSRR